jgi:ATP-binding cassette subfamily C protein
VAGAKLIRALGAGDWSRETFGAAVTAVGRWVRHNKVNTILVKLTVDPLGLAVVVAAIYVSVTIVKLPPAELLLFLVIFYRTMPRLVTLQEMLQRIIGVLPSYTAVADTLRTLEDAREPHGTRPFTGLRTQIELRNVEMRRGDRVVLADVDLVIRARETVALVGRSGAGKTTLLDLVSGILAPDRGTVLVDGVPLAEIDPAAFRTRIGLVSQDPLLFHDTIAANLRIAAPAATDAEIWDALAAAHADGFVRATRQALDTVVGDHGVRLSGGQRQRLALARALLRKPDVLLLDEPSSALDAESEAAIRSTLASLRHTVTIVVVSHRTTMVTDADHVYRIDGGRVLRTSLVDAPYAGALKVE